MSDIVERLNDVRFAAPAWMRPVVDEAADEIDRLRLAIRRLAEQDATLSVQDGNVTVTMDATLTDAEREAVERGYCALLGVEDMSAECSRWDAEAAGTMRGLLERMNHDAVPAAITVSDEDRTDKAATSHRRDRSGEPPCLAKGQVPLGSESVAGTNSCRRPSQTGRFSDRIRQFFCNGT